MEEETGKLHIVMVPWLAMGHLNPFFELSKSLALKGLQISYFTTPSNIHRLPSIPKNLTPLLKFIPCSSSTMNIENASDLHQADNRLLFQSYNAFEEHLVAFLSDSSNDKPNWIFYDFPAISWAPSLASRFGMNCALFCILNAASFVFLDRYVKQDLHKTLATGSGLFPFPTTVALRRFEAIQTLPFHPKEKDMRTDEFMLSRTCRELESKWIDLLGENCLPVGFLPPFFEKEEESETWTRICEWLDVQKEHSVIFAAFGSEVILTEEQIHEIAFGLEKSGLPFFWVLRKGLPPQGFEERIVGRGLVWKGWVPQARLLAHPAIGGFLTHGGWSSVIEGMVAGAALAILPIQYEQGLNARHMVESGYAVEIVRNDEDGYFSREEIARKLRIVMVEEEGEEVRKMARKGKEIFGSKKLHDEYITELVKTLWKKHQMLNKPI